MWYYLIWQWVSHFFFLVPSDNTLHTLLKRKKKSLQIENLNLDLKIIFTQIILTPQTLFSGLSPKYIFRYFKMPFHIYLKYMCLYESFEMRVLMHEFTFIHILKAF